MTEKIEYRVKRSITSIYTAYFEADNEEEAEEMADNLSLDSKQWDVTEYDEIEVVE